MPPENPSSLPPRKTRKYDAVLRIHDHILETYKDGLEAGPLVLMWRETINGYYLKLNADHPTWVRDDQSVHEHWLRFGKDVSALLRKKFTVVRVGRQIRELVEHGKSPELGTRRGSKKTPDGYKACLPSASNPTFGIVLFPRGTAKEDHPLIVASREFRCKSSTACLKNSVDEVRDANDLENLTKEKRDEIIGDTAAKTRKAFNEVRYPLFEGKESPPPNDEKGDEKGEGV